MRFASLFLIKTYTAWLLLEVGVNYKTIHMISLLFKCLEYDR